MQVGVTPRPSDPDSYVDPADPAAVHATVAGIHGIGIARGAAAVGGANGGDPSTAARVEWPTADISGSSVGHPGWWQ